MHCWLVPIGLIHEVNAFYLSDGQEKNIPKYASVQFYIDNVLSRIKEKKIMALKPFVDRLGYAKECYTYYIPTICFMCSLLYFHDLTFLILDVITFLQRSTG